MFDQQPERSHDMRARMIKLMVGLSAFSALAVGGASLASAASKASPPVITAPADTGAAASESTSASEAASPNDGPGGHADDPANASVDYQFQGQQ
jgi:hypothetical protein